MFYNIQNQLDFKDFKFNLKNFFNVFMIFVLSYKYIKNIYSVV